MKGRATKSRFLSGRSYRDLGRFAAGFAESLRQEPQFAAAINTDLAAFRTALLRLIRVQFPLRRGRPTDPRLDQACELLRQGKSVADVLQCQSPHFAMLDPYEQWVMKRGLRGAASRRAKREAQNQNRRHKSAAKSIPPISPPEH